MLSGPAVAGRANLLLASLLLLAPLRVSAEDAPTSSPKAPRIGQAWRDAALSLFKEAHAGFAEADGREARLGRAITLLAQQPKTAGNIDAAARALAALIDEAPGDAHAAMARFYLGRIEQLHRSPADPGAAAAHFRRLVQEHPGDPWADQAAVKLAIIELHQAPSAEELRRRFDRQREVARSLATASARRDLHLLLADVALRFELGETLALEELLHADRAGIVRPATQAQVWVQIGELARRTGRHETAREHYGKFLAGFVRDNRRGTILEHLASLPPAVAAASSP